MQQFLLYRIGQEIGKPIGFASDGICCGQIPRCSLEGASYSCVPSWIANDIDVGSSIEMDVERRGNTLLRRQQTSHVGIEFTNLAVGTRDGHPIAVRRTGRTTDEVVTFISCEHEQSVALVDPVVRQ